MTAHDRSRALLCPNCGTMLGRPGAELPGRIVCRHCSATVETMRLADRAGRTNVWYLDPATGQAARIK